MAADHYDSFMCQDTFHNIDVNFNAGTIMYATQLFNLTNSLCSVYGTCQHCGYFGRE